MWRKAKTWFLPWLLVGLVTLALLEGATRLSGYSERHIHDPIYMPFAGSRDIPYVHKPDLANAHARGHAIIHTDSLGLRSLVSGRAYGSKATNEYRIALVGDSVTFGEGIPDTADTFAQVLERRLNAVLYPTVVTVFNFGVSAYSVKEMAATLEHRMAAVQPDLVIMAIIPDDFTLSRTPAIDEAGYLTGRSTRLILDTPLRNILRRFHLLYVLRDLALSLAPEPRYNTYRPPEEVPESYGYLQGFRAVAEQRGLEYLVVLLPLADGTPWDFMAGVLARDGIHYLDLSAVGADFAVSDYVADRYDSHPSAAVHRRIGEELAAWVLAQPGLQ